MADIKWTALSWQTYLTTELNSLANAGRKLGASIDNDANLRRYVAVLLDLAAQGSARSAGAAVWVYVLPSDGTTFAYGDDSTTPSDAHRVGAFLLDAATTARFDVLTGLEAPPGDFKILIVNGTGQAFASSGNTVKYALYSETF